VIVAGMLIIGLVAFVASCQRKAEQAPGETTGTAVDTLRLKRLASGHETYLAYCSMCHGEWGEGDGPLAEQIRDLGGVKPARLNDRTRLAAMGRDEIVRVIEKGGAHTRRSNLMPPWAERISGTHIEEIADFVMSLPDQQPGTPPSTIADYLAAPPGSAPEGRKLYVQYCVLCHGPNARGDGTYADTLWARNQIRPHDLTDSVYFAKKTDQQLYVVIALGGAHSGKSMFMPVWNVTMPPNQIKDLVSYVRAISRTQARP
jgi:mono/diheme cytochrome c family protein